MRETIIRTASARRSDIAVRAAAMGVDEAFIGVLVDRFYEAVRADPELGPVFEAAIGEDWSTHLQTMKHFWACRTHTLCQLLMKVMLLTLMRCTTGIAISWCKVCLTMKTKISLSAY